MKKGTFNHFLGRKNQSLFDTKIEIKDLDNVELVLDSSAIPESGTAKVRARPTVKHYNSSMPSSDVVQGFAVPTPKVPILPPVNGPKANGTGNRENLSNGISMVVPDLEEGEIFIPPPPSMAPPPPPPQLLPPPLQFSSDPIPSPQFEDPASLQPPPMPPPKPPTPAPSLEPDLGSLKPPPMAPPKPPSEPSTANISAPISSPPTNSPEHPKCAPPQPPTLSAERPQVTPPKGQKIPPPKPTRLSSMSSMDGLSQVQAPPPPAQVPMPSSFNPQHTAKLYSLPKTSLLSGQMEREKKQRPILLLQDSDSTEAILVPVNVKLPSDVKDLDSAKPMVPPAKPARRNSSGIQLEKDLQELQENLQSTLPSEGGKATDPVSLETTQDLNKPTQPSPTPSPEPERALVASVPSETSSVIPQAESPGGSRRLTPYISRTPYYRRANESSASSSTSPMALLLAAKEREKQRSSLSRENSSKRHSYSEPTTVGIHHSQSMPNSFTVVPRSTSSSSLGGQEALSGVHDEAASTPGATVQPCEKLASEKPSRPTSATSLVAELLEKHEPEAATTEPSPSCVRDEENGEEFCMPFIPPPPEFANSDTEEESVPEPPPSFPPPEPPSQKIATPSPAPASQPPQAKAPPPPPKPKAGKPLSPPKLPVPKAEVKPKPLSQDKPKPPPTPATPPTPTTPTSSLAANQATLLSILQKKMLEMEQKHSYKEVNNTNDDWGSPLSDEESAAPVKPSPLPKSKSATTLLGPSSKGPCLDMSELERKVAKKAQDLSASAKSPASNGPQSKQPYGMTFTVRPGSKQPITPVSRGDSP